MKPIQSEEEYLQRLKEVEGYFDNEPKPGSPEAHHFAELVDAIAIYEDVHYPVDSTDRPVALIEFQVQGIKCDTPTCDYADPTVHADDFPNWIDRPCPKCGANLLTHADWETVDRMLAFAELTNQLAANGALGFAQANESGEFGAVAVELDTAGIPRIVRKD